MLLWPMNYVPSCSTTSESTPLLDVLVMAWPALTLILLSWASIQQHCIIGLFQRQSTLLHDKTVVQLRDKDNNRSRHVAV